jgi:hypothetical protein
MMGGGTILPARNCGDGREQNRAEQSRAKARVVEQSRTEGEEMRRRGSVPRLQQGRPEETSASEIAREDRIY